MPVKDVCLEMNRGLPESELYGTEETQSILSEMATQNQIMVTTTGTAQHGTRLFASISLIFLIVVKAWSIFCNILSFKAWSIFCSSSTSKLVGSTSQNLERVIIKSKLASRRCLFFSFFQIIKLECECCIVMTMTEKCGAHVCENVNSRCTDAAKQVTGGK
jgi:hypothetical protein